MPGTSAIWAALYPDTTNFYYFLADGKGGTIFSQTLEQQEAQMAINSTNWDNNEPNSVLDGETATTPSPETAPGGQG